MSQTSRPLVHHFLESSARSWPEKHAVIHGEARVSYKELNDNANRIAQHFISHGISVGDRVVLLLENCREYVAAYYGCLKAGAVAVPLNPDLMSENLAPVLAATTPRAVVLSSKSEKSLGQLDFVSSGSAELLIARPRSVLSSARDLAEITELGNASNPDVPIREEDLANINFTSGSTGKPKGVMLSHRNIITNTQSIVGYLELTSSDIQMVVLPFFYVMGQSLLNTHVASGGTVVITNSFAYPATVVQQMLDETVTGFAGVPSTYAYLLHHSPFREMRGRFTHLRYCTQAGGHMARHTKEELLTALPEHTKLYVMYGATEAAARLTYVEPHRLREKIDSIGVPIAGVTLTVRNEQGRELLNGESGELVANGDNIMLGYWNDPEATRKALTAHGYHTGDFGYQDEDGYFYVTGRKDSQLKVGGHRLEPQEIEDVLVASGLVVECAVVAVPDPLVGHRLAAVAVALGGLSGTERNLLLHASKALPRHKLPTEIRFVKSLPKSSNGKIDRKACMELVGLHAGRNSPC